MLLYRESGAEGETVRSYDGSASFKFFIFTVLPDFWNFPLWSVALATISSHPSRSRSPAVLWLMATSRFVVSR